MKTIKSLGGEGILNEEDIESFSKAESRIVNLMKDGRWHSATRIIAVSKQREGLRRLRALRSKGMTIERERRSKSREFYYKLTTP